MKTSRARVLCAFLLTLFLNIFLFHRIGSVATVLVLGAYYVFGMTTFLSREIFKMISFLVGLLSSGDPVFAYKVVRVFQEIGKVFDIKFWFQPIAHLVFSVFVLAALLPQLIHQ